MIHELELEDGHDRTIVNMQPPTVEEVDEDADDVDADEVPATEQNDGADAEESNDDE